MSGPSIRTAALLVLLLACTPAHAKKVTLLSGSPLGFGLMAGVEGRPQNGFISGGQVPASLFSNYFAAEPFLDFGNVQFRLHGGWHFYPLLNGAGIDNSGATFTESSDAGSLKYGGRMLLAPYVGETGEARAYFVVGALTTVTNIKNSRKYLNGTMAGKTNVERVRGNGFEINGGVGFEFLFIQNYSIQMEVGYANHTATSFTYQTSTDTSGATRTSGETAKNSSGGEIGFHTFSPYFQLGLNLNL